jgi:hypothetical protein
MVHNHKWKGFALFGTTALAVAGLALPASAAFTKDTVFTSYADTHGGPKVVMVDKDKGAVDFATVDPGTDRAWLAPLGFSPDGRLYLAMATQNGTLIDVTDGGDRTSAKPIAQGLFTALPHKVGGLAFDAEGNAYLTLENTQAEDSNGDDPTLTFPIARVNLKTGAKSTINGTFNHAKGLVVHPDANGNEILYIAEQETGRILTYNLTTDKLDSKPFATGFPSIGDHGMAALAFDKRTPAHLFVTWRMDPNDNTTGALFDITNGGDFSDLAKTPPVLKDFPFTTDVNGLAFDSKNSVFMGDDGNPGHIYFSLFDATKGTFGDLNSYTTDDLGGGDIETVAIAP